MKYINNKFITLIFSMMALFAFSGCGSSGTPSDHNLIGGGETPGGGVPGVTITSIHITPTDVTVPKGTTGTYSAIALYSDNTQEDITKQVVWTSADVSIVSIIASGDEAGDAEALEVGSTTITAALNEVTSNTARVTVTNATLEKIIVTPFIEKVANGINVQYRATGIYSDKTHGNLAQWATWQSSTTSIATIDTLGLAQSLSPGTTKISATLASVTSNPAILRVTDATVIDIQITPADISVPKGTTDTYTAIAYFTDNTSENITRQATWTSADPAIVSIWTSRINGGHAEALAVGDTTITASFSGVTSNTAKVTVTDAILQSIVVTPAIESVAVGIDVPYTATGIYSDNTSVDLTADVSWSSTDNTVAAIQKDSDGYVWAETIAVGNTNITALFEGVTSNTATLEVTAATITSIQITPADISVPKGTTGTYTAIAYFTDNTSEDVTRQATWISGDDTIVAIVPTGVTAGDALAMTVGNTTITASFDGATSNTATVEVTAATLVSIQVDPAAKTTPLGVDIEYTATGIYTDNMAVDLTSQVSWNVVDRGVAAIVVDNGEAIAETIAVGNTNITALFDGVTSNTATLEVTAATITSIQITPADTSVPKGTTGTYTATAYYTDSTNQDITRQATWISGDDTTVSIVPTGNTAGDALALTVGNTTITASFDGKTSNTAAVEVTAATLVSIQIDPVNYTTPLGVDVEYTATGIYTDNMAVDLTAQVSWNVADKSVAAIFVDNGKAWAETIAVGNTNITALFDGVTSNTAVLEVTAATITSIQVTPADTSVPKGTTGTYTAIAYFTDSTSEDITRQATWISANATIVSIVTTGVTAGDALAMAVGNTTIIASFDDKTSNTATIEVTAATLVSIQVDPAVKTTPLGVDVAYTATGIYTDNMAVDLTEQASWNSTDKGTAAIQKDIDGYVWAETIAVGNTNITALFDGVTSNTAVLEVTAATITSIQVTPADTSVPKGTTGTYTAIAYFTDKTSEDITRQATWISGDANVVVIVSTGDTAGDALAMTVGSTTITASFDGVTSNTAAIEVIELVLSSIEIVAHDTTFPRGTVVDFIGLAHYGTNNDDTQIITQTGDWSSVDTSIATVDKGEIVAIGVGTTTIVLDYEGKRDTQSITVTQPPITSILIAPASYSMSVDGVLHYLATANYDDGETKDVTRDVIWHSSDESVATVTNHVFAHGKATGLSAGSTNITVTYEGVQVGNTAILNVIAPAITLDSIVVTPANITVTQESYVEYTATGHYSDGHTQDITLDVDWASSDTGVATIGAIDDITDGDSIALAIADGTTIISAALDSITGSTSLTVSGNCGTTKPLTIEITPDPYTMSVGEVKQFHLIGHWAGCDREITFDPAAVWNSDDEDIVSMRSKGGEAISHKLGNVPKINAKYRGLTDSTTVDVQ